MQTEAHTETHNATLLSALLEEDIPTDTSTSTTDKESPLIRPTSLTSTTAVGTSIPVGTSISKATSGDGHSGVTTDTESRALELLGAGIAAEAVASALGVTPSRIAQLLAEDYFASQVAELRYESLQQHNKRDGKYDSLEDRLIDKLDKSMPLLVRPNDILKAITVVNGAKRRGQSAPAQVTNTQNIVNLVLPQVITEAFSVDINNQVTRAGEQELLTMPSGDLLKRVEETIAIPAKESPNV